MILPSNNLTLPILVVEDSVDLCENIMEILMFEGYQVVTAANGELALAAIARTQFHLIVLDLRMPVMDGLEFLTAYARLPAPHAPVILCTGSTDKMDSVDLPLFVMATLLKPYQLRHLLTLVKEYTHSAQV